MAHSLFRMTAFHLRLLVDNIDRGDIALPDIQRPFVWGAAKVRDLFDSMYKGFPVGYLLFWETGVEAGARQIGVDDKDARVARWLIVDGQQRLTSLYSVMTGTAIVREDYVSSRIKLAFRPVDGVFAVTDAAISRDPEFLPDITDLWVDYRRTTDGFFERLEAARGPIENVDRNRYDDAFDRVRDLQSFNFSVVELDSAVEEEQVADVFVRINSEGVTLNQADFILTLMSVFWDKGRRQLEEFSRACRMPSIGGASPFNWYIRPQPAQLLRATVALAFRRAVLKQVYSLLRGKDLDTGAVNPKKRDEQFQRLQTAQEEVLDLTNWHEFLQCLERAGFRGERMISSETAVIYTYALWLIGRVDLGVSLDQLRELIARWFFMAHTTARYSGAFEGRVESDLSILAGLQHGDARGFATTLNKIIDDILTSDFWSITLPNELATSASKSPALLAYIAALNILDSDALLSTGKVRSRLDPAIIAKKGIERHHLFPRNHLKKRLNIKEIKRINQIANMALVEWSDNIAISDSAPHEYWPDQVRKKKEKQAGLTDERIAKQTYWHALPEGWLAMDYDHFLAKRRNLMAQVTREAFGRLGDPTYEPVYPIPSAPDEGSETAAPVTFSVSLAELISAGRLAPGTILSAAKEDLDVAATLLDDGRILLDEETYDSPSAAARAVLDHAANGWRFWVADTPEGQLPLAVIRHRYVGGDTDEALDTEEVADGVGPVGTG